MELWQIPAAFAAGVLTGTGIGGGGLFVIFLTVFAGTEHLRAQWLNLVLFVSSCAFSLPYHLGRRNVDTSAVLFAVAFAVPGTLAGYALRAALPVAALRKIFGAMLVLTAGAVLLKRGEKNGSSAAPPRGT